MSIENKKELDLIDNLIPKFEERGVDLNLDRIKGALKDLRNPCCKIPAIQVVGTNGKGSIANFIKSGLKAAGIETGLTTSPHLVSWCERISTNKGLISPPDLLKHLEKLQPIFKKHKLTPFELIITAAFEYFEANKVEILILEAGLGGRLDATTAHPWRPIIAIAPIGLDHCEFLGNSLKEITNEKVEVITSGSKVISTIQHPEVEEVINKKVLQQKASIQWVKPLPEEWVLGIPGSMQLQNASIAKAVLEALTSFGWEVNGKQIRKGLSQARWPARLQSVKWKGLSLLIDGAHNSHAANQLSKERETWAHQKNGIYWILGIQSHKEGPEIIRNLIKQQDLAWIVPIPYQKSWTKSELENSCPELSAQLNHAENVEDSLEEIRQKTWPKSPPVITGSLYLLGSLFSKRVFDTD